MYFDSPESFELVKSILLRSVPYDITLKKSYESGVLLVMNDEYTLSFLNETAAKFLDLCNGKKNVSEVLHEMQLEYDVDISTLTNDVIQLIPNLQKNRILYVEISQ